MKVHVVTGEKRIPGEQDWWVEGVGATRGVAEQIARDAYEVQGVTRRLALVDGKPYGGEWGAAGIDVENSLKVEKYWEIRFDILEEEVRTA